MAPEPPIDRNLNEAKQQANNPSLNPQPTHSEKQNKGGKNDDSKNK